MNKYLMESPRFVHSKIQRHSGLVAIFYLNKEFRVMRLGMKHYQRNYLFYPDLLMGVYSQEITENELRDDMEFMANNVPRGTG